MLIVAPRHLLDSRLLAVLIRCIESGSGAGVILIERPSDDPPAPETLALAAEESRKVLSALRKDSYPPSPSGSGAPWPPEPRRRFPLKISPTRARR